ncbi:MAG: hypothetical protein SPG65_01300 [Campylobacter sp.]|nr:hypothetical protein [Campylobacter sp.]
MRRARLNFCSTYAVRTAGFWHTSTTILESPINGSACGRFLQILA